MELGPSRAAALARLIITQLNPVRLVPVSTLTKEHQDWASEVSGFQGLNAAILVLPMACHVKSCHHEAAATIFTGRRRVIDASLDLNMGIDMDSYTLPGPSKDLIVFVELTRSGRLFVGNGDGWEVLHETALPRSDRQALARALPILPGCSPTADKNIFGQYTGSDDEFGMDFLEIFSVPRIAVECCKTGVRRTESIDFLTGWDFGDPKVKREALLIQRQAKPFCTFVCPPCRMFCIMHENLNRNNMGEQRWSEELGGLSPTSTSA